MARRRGIYTRLAEKLNTDLTSVRKQIMSTGIKAAKKLLEEAGVVGRPGKKWFGALKLALPTMFAIIKTDERIPSVEEVINAVKTKYPNWRSFIEAYVPGKVAVPATA